MDIDIILECDVSPQQVAELAVAAEKLGIRALWSSNYHQNYDCFMALDAGRDGTSKIIAGAARRQPVGTASAENGQRVSNPERGVERPRHGGDKRRRRRVSVRSAGKFIRTAPCGRSRTK